MNQEQTTCTTCELRVRFAANLKACRAILGISVYKMAKDTDLQSSYLYRLENPKYNITPSFEIIEKIADYFHVNPSVLFE